SKAALNYLAQANPRAVPFEELMAQARGRAGLPTGSHTYRGGGARDAYALAANLLQAYGYSDQLVSLHVCAPPVAHEAGERPCASPVARLFAQDSNRVPNLWHIQVALTPEQQLLLQLLDGTQDRTHLLEKFTEAIRNDPRVASPDQAMTDHERTQLLNSGLDSLARAAFLIE
ncbi:MAG: hypothetical protein JXB35_09855, partial [Anaerolineae bacterium]|nr:hypothetical protein [Anaerolineae bacterium]